ncbi:hypothetical protein CTAYLR_000970 [Chrysophaeum taylorii]|uniref:Uncharacterized protein n=1 Tax=Chrysophaeum taylorii TaxID=2483200 RepID=A0AAD7UG28_9STRA|nr:hypothetical protein CTAYLR_000970 [Chrysophaeum taylorii]
MTMPKLSVEGRVCARAASTDGQSRVAKLAVLRARYCSIAAGETIESVEEAARRLEENRLVNYDASARQLSVASVRLLGRALRSSTTIRILNLWGAAIGIPGAEALGPWLGSTTSLEGIDLRQNELGEHGMRLIAKGLEKNTTLLHLSLGSNAAGPCGVTALADALVAAGHRSKIAILDLDSNDLGVAGGAQVARILVHSQSLVHLNLSYNRLGDAGLALLAPGVVASTCLASLSIRCIGISVIGASIFADVIAGVPLHSVDLGQNDLGDDGARLFIAVLDRAPNLDTLNVTGSVSDDLAREIQRKLDITRGRTFVDAEPRPNFLDFHRSEDYFFTLGRRTHPAAATEAASPHTADLLFQLPRSHA